MLGTFGFRIIINFYIGLLAPDGTWVEFVDQTRQATHALAIDSQERVWVATDEGL